MKAKIMVNKNHTFTFKGFTVQVGMIYGFDNTGNPFVSNGNIYNNSANVYTITGYDVYNYPIWEKQKVCKGSKLFEIIERGVKKRTNNNINSVHYATSSELEADRWAIKTKRDEGILHNGCNSNHYGYVMTRRECWC